MHLGCHPRPGPGPARGRIPEPGPVTRDPNPGSSTHCVLDPGPGPARDPSSGPGRVTDDNQGRQVYKLVVDLHGGKLGFIYDDDRKKNVMQNFQDPAVLEMLND